MAPHAESPSAESPLSNGVDRPPVSAPDSTRNGLDADLSKERMSSMLPSTSSDDLHDLITVGFGPASLAVAVALHDALEFTHGDDLSELQGRRPKVCFLERQDQFAWHTGMQLPGAKMQISWIKDLATMRNPRSQFTFLNYLSSVGRLAKFTNLDTFLPLRVEYEAYMRWCAGWFEHLARYSEEVVHIVPEKSRKGSRTVDSFAITSRNLQTQQLETRRTRNVLIAVGGQPSIPAVFPQGHDHVIHSSSYAKSVGNILRDSEASYRIAVIGGGQSAAEIFNDAHTRFPHARVDLFLRHSALKPSDDSPFVNEVFDPERVDGFYAAPATVRAAASDSLRATNYSVVRLELLEKIYADLYEQRVREPDVSRHRFHIRPNRAVVAAEPRGNGVHLRFESTLPEHAESASAEELEADLVIVATGYSHDLHEKLLCDARGLMPGGDEQGKTWAVRRDYAVEFAKDTVASDAGVWLQGCNEQTHGLSDTLLSILATRGGEIVRSIFGSRASSTTTNGVH